MEIFDSLRGDKNFELSLEQAHNLISPTGYDFFLFEISKAMAFCFFQTIRNGECLYLDDKTKIKQFNKNAKVIIAHKNKRFYFALDMSRRKDIEEFLEE